MKNKFLIISLAMSGFAFSQSVDSTCVAITSKGLNCKIKVNIDTTNVCHHHKNKTVNYVKSVVCNALTTKNTNCKLKTKHTSKKCHHHRD